MALYLCLNNEKKPTNKVIIINVLKKRNHIGNMAFPYNVKFINVNAESFQKPFELPYVISLSVLKFITGLYTNKNNSTILGRTNKKEENFDLFFLLSNINKKIKTKVVA